MNTQITKTVATIFAITLFSCISPSFSCAQSTDDLAPSIAIPLVACAEAGEDGNVKVIYAMAIHQTVKDESAKKAKPEKDEAKPTEFKKETYVVMVPVQVTEKVDGKMVTKVKYREERRTRMIPVNSSGEKKEVYTVQVPIKERRIVEGKPVDVTVMTTQTRTRTIPAGQKLVATQLNSELILKADSLQFFLADGTRLKNAAGIKRMSERIPVIFVGESGNLDPFYQQIVRPDTLLIYDKNKSLFRQVTSKKFVDEKK